MTIVVVARSRDPQRQAEALRAALGLTLRGARVEVVVEHPLQSALAERAAATLATFGHSILEAGELGAAIDGADAVEVWT